MLKSEFGLIGLGVMGSNLAQNIADKGFRLSVYNRSEGEEAQVVDAFIESVDGLGEVSGYTDLKAFVHSLEKPRKILLMVTAGNVVDQVIDSMKPLLEENDIIIDGGNSYFEDTIRRANDLSSLGLKFIGCGISGGAEGARNGPSLMPDGVQIVYKNIQPVMEAIAAKDQQGKPCCNLIGGSGAGHFVKMIHNGIEYAEMQLLAEVFSLVSIGRSREEVSDIFHLWKSSSESSFLLDITSDILKKKIDDEYLLDLVLDAAKNKGTGSWSSIIALELGYPADMINSAVFARYISAFKEQRVEHSRKIQKNHSVTKMDESQILNALRFARIINHHQGFDLIQKGSLQFNWTVDLSELARIWTNGCIIRSSLMNKCSSLLRDNESILNSKDFFEELTNMEPDIKEVIKNAVDNRVPISSLYTAYNFFTSMTTERLGANLIQAQRDYFGAHTYQRVDAPTDEYFHSNWKNL